MTTRQRERMKSVLTAIAVLGYFVWALGWRWTAGFALALALAWLVFDYLPYRRRIKRLARKG